jgi:hypothetical protein
LERVREIYSVERHMDGLLDVYENVCR